MDQNQRKASAKSSLALNRRQQLLLLEHNALLQRRSNTLQRQISLLREQGVLLREQQNVVGGQPFDINNNNITTRDRNLPIDVVYNE